MTRCDLPVSGMVERLHKKLAQKVSTRHHHHRIVPTVHPHRHSINEIASQLSPAPQCTGIEMLQADSFDVHCFQTLTGTKFVMVAERYTPDVDELLRTTYDVCLWVCAFLFCVCVRERVCACVCACCEEQARCIHDNQRKNPHNNPVHPPTHEHRIYDLYTDFVLKNPFYEVEMPIKCELFDTHLLELVRQTHARLGTIAA